jgi:hypothetical protein
MSGLQSETTKSFAREGMFFSSQAVFHLVFR